MIKLLHRVLLGVASAWMLAVGGCGAHSFAAVGGGGEPAALVAPPFVLTAAVFGERGGSPAEFSFQFVLTDDTGTPVLGPLDLTAQLVETPVGEVLSEVTFEGLAGDGNGRYNICLPLPEPADLLLDAAELEVRVLLDQHSQLVVPLKHVPRAWVAERSRSARTAEFASTAGQLEDDASVELVLRSGFSNRGGPYDVARATRVGRVVFLSGFVRRDSSSTATWVTTLPVGMRPAGIIYGHALSPGGFGEPDQVVVIEALPDGVVRIGAPSGVGLFSLTDVQFPIAE